jgi:hypothetical protein
MISAGPKMNVKMRSMFYEMILTNSNDITIFLEQSWPDIHLVALNTLYQPGPRGKFTNHRSWDLRQRPCEGCEKNEAASSEDLSRQGVEQNGSDTIHRRILNEVESEKA